jgi:hypothetical protein
MPTTEPATPRTVLSLFCGDTGTDDVVASMERHLPPDGMATGRVHRRFDLTRATYKLLDSRILEAAAKSLNQDIAAPLARWLGTFQNLREAAAKTGSGTEDDVLVALEEPTPFTSTQGSDVVLAVGEEQVATIGFQLELTLELGKTSVAVRHGAIEEIVCTVCRASASFTLDGCPEPLWEPEPVALPDLHVPVRPALVVPLVPRPRQPAEQLTEQPEARPVTERPPVPGRHRGVES